MAYVSWTAAFEDTPSGADPGSVIDNKFNELKEQTRRLMQAAGMNLPDVSVTEDGTTPHTPGALVDLPGVIAVDAGGSGIGGQIWNSSGTQILLDPTDTGVAFPLLATGGNITSEANPGHGHDVTFAIQLGSSGGGLVDGVMFENRGNGTMELLEATLHCFIAPDSGGSVFVQMRLLPSSWLAPDDAGTEVFDDVNRPEVTTLLFKGTPKTTFDDEFLEVGEVWTFEIDTDAGSPNTAAELVLHLKVRRL